MTECVEQPVLSTENEETKSEEKSELVSQETTEFKEKLQGLMKGDDDEWPPKDWEDDFKLPAIYHMLLVNHVPESVADMATDPEIKKQADAAGFGGTVVPALLFCHAPRKMPNLEEDGVDEKVWKMYPVKDWPGFCKCIYIHIETANLITAASRLGTLAWKWRMKPHPTVRGVFMATHLYLIANGAINHSFVLPEKCANCNQPATRRCRTCHKMPFCTQFCEDQCSQNGVHRAAACHETVFHTLAQQGAQARVQVMETQKKIVAAKALSKEAEATAETETNDEQK